MICFVLIVLRLAADLVGLAVLAIRPKQSVGAENLVLRRQLALYKERGVKPRRIDGELLPHRSEPPPTDERP